MRYDTHPSSRSRTLLLTVTLLTAIAGACTPRPRTPAGEASIVDAMTQGYDESVRRDLRKLRTATAAFSDLTAAHKAGYPTKVPACVRDSAGAGGMGHHYFDRALFDSIVELEKPEMLLYAPQPGGGVKFVAVEYVVPYRLRPPTATPPVLFGQPFRKHEQFQYWYLHVWAWERNPTRLFEDWNPAVTC
jgi:hypothetical protein